MVNPGLDKINAPVLSLSDYIKINSRIFSEKDINLLRLQILDFFNYAKRYSLGKWIQLDFRELYVNITQKKVIFPSKTEVLETDIELEYTRFGTFLNEQNLLFVKPKLIFYSDTQNQKLISIFHKNVADIAAHPCVKRIYFLNPESKKKLGAYEVPLVHLNWVVLGSTLNLLIEIDEQHEIPASWKYKLYSKDCNSFYYHLGNIKCQINSPYIEQYTNINFFHHLLDAYLFFPSKGDRIVKNEYLKKFKAILLYQKQEQNLESTSDKLKTFIEKLYELKVEGLERVSPSSFNEVYKIIISNQNYIIKIMNRDDFTPSVDGQSGLHSEYEADLLQAISKDDLPVLMPVQSVSGEVIHEFDGRYCMMFPFIEEDSNREIFAQNIDVVSKSLALIHKSLATANVTTEQFRFNEFVEYWIEQYSQLYIKYDQNKRTLGQLKAMLPDIIQAKKVILESQKLPYLHSHGNISPLNFLFTEPKILLFDFQLSHYGPRLEDLVDGAIEFSWCNSKFEQELMDKFILSYDRENNLTEEEKILLPVMFFLQAILKLARLFRIDNIFGSDVDKDRINALLNFTRTKRKTIKKIIY